MRRLLCATVALLACSLGGAPLAVARPMQKQDDQIEETLIGWRGEVYEPKIVQEAKYDKTKDRFGTEPWIEQISWKPRAWVYHNMLSEAECDHLVGIGSQRVSRSLVIDSKTGASKLDDIRTSYGAAFARGEDPIIAEIEERIAEWTHLPPEHGEPIQILRYVNGQKYDAHWDWFDDPVHHREYLAEGNRYATVLMYLSNVEYGGETSLPLATPLDPVLQSTAGLSPCATRMGIALRPRKGDVLLFMDMDVLGTKGDRLSLHTACPAINGTKWTATKWIHSKSYGGNYDAMAQAARCVDADRANCSKWVQQGLCHDDPDKMIGLTGACRKSCGDCRECHAGDVICMRHNLAARRPGTPKVTVTSR